MKKFVTILVFFFPFFYAGVAMSSSERDEEEKAELARGIREANRVPRTKEEAERLRAERERIANDPESRVAYYITHGEVPGGETEVVTVGQLRKEEMRLRMLQEHRGEAREGEENLSPRERRERQAITAARVAESERAERMEELKKSEAWQAAAVRLRLENLREPTESEIISSLPEGQCPVVKK